MCETCIGHANLNLNLKIEIIVYRNCLLLSLIPAKKQFGGNLTILYAQIQFNLIKHKT